MNQKRYTAIFHTGNEDVGSKGFMKWRNITNIPRLLSNIKTKYPNAKFCHLYDKKTKERVDYISFK